MKKIGLATVGVVNIKKDVIESDDFLAAKIGDIEAANRVIDLVWKSEKTEQLRENVKEPAVLLSMPSTTKTNVIPVSLAAEMAEQLAIPYVSGDDLFFTLHNTASKKIPRDKRVFNKREYVADDENEVKRLLQGKEIIIVDDVITTGGSIRNFTEFLREQQLNVTHVVGLMGDRRLALDSGTQNKLGEMLKEKNVNISIDSISHITRTEAGCLLRRLNGLRGKNGLERFTEDLRGIQRERVVNNTQRNSGRGNYSTEREDLSNEQVGEKIPTYSNIPTEKKGIKEEWEAFFAEQLEKISRQAERILVVTEKQIERQKRLAVDHQKSEPLKPKSILAIFKKASYEEVLENWDKQKKQIKTRLSSLKMRQDICESYLEKDVSNHTRSKAQNLALSRSFQLHPELSRKYQLIKQEERKEFLKKRKAKAIEKNSQKPERQDLSR